MLTCFKHTQLSYDKTRQVYWLTGISSPVATESLHIYLGRSGYKELLDDIRQCRWDKFTRIRTLEDVPFFFDALYPWDVSLNKSRGVVTIEVRRKPEEHWDVINADTSLLSLAQTPEEVDDLMIIQAWIDFAREKLAREKLAI